MVVTVTYGNRKHLLEQLVHELLTQEVSKIIIVNNGASWEVKAWAQTLSPKIVVISLHQNTGSAGGFAIGISKAMELKAEMIWLLDDDNKPLKNTLTKLLTAYHELSQVHPQEPLMVLGLRASRDLDLIISQLHPIQERPSSFLGFHVFDIPKKIGNKFFKFLKPRVSSTHSKLPDKIHIQEAPYGGILFHRNLIQTIGLPRADFVLYCDDLEFTYRVTQHHGSIYIITDALIEDLEPASNEIKYYPMWNWIRHLPPEKSFRTYYHLRNKIYFNTYCKMSKISWMYHINRYTYLGLLWIVAIFNHRSQQYALLAQAISDGVHRHLGVGPEFQGVAFEVAQIDISEHKNKDDIPMAN
jgi:GT2 family glycosyltransferase